MILSGLTIYVEEQKMPLVTKAIAGGGSAELFRPQTGLKPGTEAAINILNTTIEFGDGSTCGFDAKGSDEFTQRRIKVGSIKVNKEYCDKDMRPYWMGYQVTTAANRGEAAMPFEQYFVEEVAKQIANKNEKALWQGDVDSLDPNLNRFDGLLKILDEASGSTVVPTASASTIGEAVLNAIKSIPVEVIDQAKIVLGQDDFIALALELSAKNLFHYTPELQAAKEFMYPGTSILVKALPGLNSTSYIVATDFANNVVLGTDLVNDSETFKLWFSDDDDVYKLKVEFGLGVQVAFPEQVVVYKWK